MSEKFELSRRKALGGLATIGLAGAGAGLGTSAYFSDEESFTNNELTAGELDLIVDYWTSVDQGAATGDTGSTTGSNTINGNPAVAQYQIADVKPGDSGFLVFCPKVVDNPSWLWVGSDGVTDYENGQTEPEMEVDDSGGDPGEGNGELSEAIQVTVSYCEYVGDEGGDRTDPENYEGRELNNPDDYTLADLGAELENGFPIDGDDSTEGVQPYPASDDVGDQAGPCLCVEWEVPTDVGNEIQTDSVEFDIEFVSQQSRHNDELDNPFAPAPE
jgi:predicted ribosomally synthesized peptide with SipW-like signal peptide